jgi:hypothetical protein
MWRSLTVNTVSQVSNDEHNGLVKDYKNKTIACN